MAQNAQNGSYYVKNHFNLDPSSAPVQQNNDIRVAGCFDSLSSTLMHDNVAYVHPGARRTAWRFIMLLIAVGALTGLTVVKYTGRGGLSSDILVVRKGPFTKFEDCQQDYTENGTCPCQSQENQWSTFVAVKPAVQTLINISGAAYNAVQCQNIILSGSTGLPTQQQVINELNASGGDNPTANAQKIENNYVLYGLHLMCINTLSQFQIQLGSVDGGDTFSSAALRNSSELIAAWNTYLTNRLNQQRQLWSNSFFAQGVIPTAISKYTPALSGNCNSGTNVTCAQLAPLAELSSSNQEAGIDLAQSLATAMFVLNSEMAKQVLSYSSQGQATTYKQTVIGLLREYMRNSDNIDVSFEQFREACKPRYCDIVSKKSVAYRVSEALTAVGGLWTSIFFGITIGWWFINQCNIPGRQATSFEVWHNNK